jgi:hypothetical protein
MSITDTIDAFKQRRLEFDCVEMTLIQQAEPNPISFKGKGYIRQTAEDVVTFKLFAEEIVNTDMFRDLSARLALKSGEIFPESTYYTLTATAFDRTVWKAERIIPDPSWPGGDALPIIKGNLAVLSTEWITPRADHAVRLHFLEEAEVPCMADSFQFSANNCDFSVRKLENEFVLEAKSKDKLIPEFHTRIQEALRFMLAQSVAWRVLGRHDGDHHRLELASATPRSAKTRLDPPIAVGHAYLGHSWRLFSHYLDYVIRTTPHPYWNTCSYHLHNACEASANSVDAWAVGLSVAVEGIAGLIAFEPDPLEATELEQLRSWALEQIANHPQHQKYLNRLQGLLNMLTLIRPQDRIKHLVDRGYADKQQMAAWVALRNRHVHPGERDLKSIELEKFQMLFDLLNQVTVLMYHLVFHLIGYAGKYTDYASRNYPTKDYPLNVAPAA